MICDELDQFLHPFLDGEFDAAERLEVEQHLSTCPSCTARFEAEARMQDALRERMRDALVPARAGLRDTVRQSIRREHRRIQLLSWGRWGAAALVAAAAGVTYLHLRPNPRERYLEDAALRHSRRLPYEVQAVSPAELEAWFDGKLSYRVPIPQLANAKLTGARLSNVRDREAAYISYQASPNPGAQPRRVGLFVFDDENDELLTAPWPSVDVQEMHGYRIASWRSGGIVYELVTDLEEDQIRRLLSPQRPLPSPPPALLAQPPSSLRVIPAALEVKPGRNVDAPAPPR